MRAIRPAPLILVVALAALMVALSVFPVHAQSKTPTEVPSNWVLTPAGLSVGDEFRLLSATSGTSLPSSSDISTYNAFVQNAAASGHGAIQGYSSGFRVVGSTAAVDARDNTSTTCASSDEGVPIYWLGGSKVAAAAADFYDRDWDDEVNATNASGTSRPFDNTVSANRPFTGSNHNGTGNSGNELGESFVRVGRPNNSESDRGPINGGSNTSRNNNRPFYGLSPVFRVEGELTPALSIEDGEGDEGGNETFTVTLTDPWPNALMAEATAKGMIRNDDAALGALPALAQAQTVVRGPYLQSGTPSSVIVKWRTDEPTDSVVRYGLAPDSLTLSATNSDSTTEHEVQLTSLSADVKYFYSVGTSADTLAGGDRDHFVVTAPIPGTAKPTRIWVIGDSGTANANAGAVRDAFLNFTGPRDPDLWIMLGDNAYGSGTDDAYQRAVFETYPQVLRRTVLWPALGNHDGHTADSTTESGPYYDIFSLPRNGEAGGVPSRTEAYYSFDYGNMHFIVLDSYETDRSPEGAMMTWLEADLQASDKEWVIAFWHHAPYSRGSRDSDTQERMIEMRQNAVPILERYGVDLVLAGHSHSYERSYLIDGHYGLSDTFTDAMKKSPGDGSATGDGAYRKPVTVGTPHAGTVYVVAGSCGHHAKQEGRWTTRPLAVSFSDSRVNGARREREPS